MSSVGTAARTEASYVGLRGFLDVLEQAGELTHVLKPVALEQEIGAVCVHNLRAGGPALLFERPGNSDVPLLVNLLSARRRYALAMGVPQSEVHAFWNERADHPIPPLIVEGPAPCQEVVISGADVDVSTLPVPRWNALDGGQFLTLSCHISRDPATGQRNVGIYRNQVHDARTLGLLSGPFGQMMLQHRQAPDEPFPVALAMGVDPRIAMVAATPVPFGVDEMAVAGALRGAPFELVPCKTIPLEVPADAELVIEAEVRPAEKREEGPFGEYTGHYGGPRLPRTTIHIKAITHRRNPILNLAYQGAPPHETEVMAAFGKEAELLRTIALPGITGVHLTPGGCGALHLVVAVEKLYEGYGKMVGLAALSSPASRSIKRVIVVDRDVDPFDATAVEWAVATRVQADRDVEILRAMPGTSIDPSLPQTEQTRTARTSKMIIDATRYDARTFPAVCLPDEAAMARVERDWATYGIPLRTSPR
jgi:4-hydroxy-3-polyprenylbenzoate decarboxylase/2,5-furandicarboxylate decarboxylase 1